MMDHIRIHQLRVPVRVGAGAQERARTQPIVINIEIGADLKGPAASDDLEDTVDYHEVVRAVSAQLRSAEVHLLEHLADKVAAIVLGFSGVLEVAVEVAKEPPPMAEDIAAVVVRLERTRVAR